MSWLLFLLVSAEARDRCIPLDDQALRTLVANSQAAVDRGDQDLLHANLDEVQARVPCMGFTPAPRLWAEVLVLESIDRFQRNEDWQTPLSSAIHIRQSIDRGVGGQHPIATFEAPPVPEPGASAPRDLELFVDGQPSGNLPPASGMHLVQRHDGRWWSSTIVENEPVPNDFLARAATPPPRIASEFRISAVGGFGTTLQRPDDAGDDWSGTDFVPAAPERTGLGGISGSAEVTFFSPFGVRAEAEVLPSPRVMGARGSLFAIYARQSFWFGYGPTLVNVDSFPGNEHQANQVLVPVAGIGFRTGGIDVNLRGGYRPFIAQGGLRLAYSWATPLTRPTVGLMASGWRQEMEQPILLGTDARTIAVTTLRVGLTVGIRWGTL